MAAPRALLLRAPGTNCDAELAFAFESAGARPESLHINSLRERPNLLQDFQILALPGGFSYGDDVAAGKILANQLSTFFSDELRAFRDAEKLILGVCNGFQALLKSGLLVPPDEDGPLATLTNNTHGYQDRWIRMSVSGTGCPWLADMESLEAPVAHGEGNFRCRAEWIRLGLEQAGQVVLRYINDRGQTTSDFPANPNGSDGGVAGITDVTGRVLGLMPHPERNVLPTHHPHWTRRGLAGGGDGIRLFRNAVKYFG
ncbi:MAG: phosphoribosylformylglycinamidine synthase subunit PurQ [Gemmataceae bacterium]|nr:phosphoribosylformylglycinamidine synthase subunit PurQ [Gemmataceae bacterium]